MDLIGKDKREQYFLLKGFGKKEIRYAESLRERYLNLNDKALKRYYDIIRPRDSLDHLRMTLDISPKQRDRRIKYITMEKVLEEIDFQKRFIDIENEGYKVRRIFTNDKPKNLKGLFI